MFSEDTIFDVVGCLEFEPGNPTPKSHREYLKSMAKFHQVIPITNTELLSKIHQTYRVQYIQDVVLPTPSVFEENMLSTLSSFVFFNKVEIVSLILEDEKFLADLFSELKDAKTGEERRKESRKAKADTGALRDKACPCPSLTLTLPVRPQTNFMRGMGEG